MQMKTDERLLPWVFVNLAHSRMSGNMFLGLSIVSLAAGYRLRRRGGGPTSLEAPLVERTRTL